MTRPILWSFRRCPYAMRARLAIQSAEVEVELREVFLRDKPQAFLAVSPNATVPHLECDDGSFEHSFDIMQWALGKNDPEGWLAMPGHGYDLVEQADGPFKAALDRYKYASRFDDVDVDEERHKAGLFLHQLEKMLETNACLFGPTLRLADMAVLPFVRQFAHVDLDWFNAQPWPNLAAWLEAFKASNRFRAIMPKYAQWQSGQGPVIFPDRKDT